MSVGCVVPPISIRQRILKGGAGYALIPANNVPPISIRQRILKEYRPRTISNCVMGSTHLDPSEDTESGRTRTGGLTQESSTHLDPSEDTERILTVPGSTAAVSVPPISIRQRILKGSRSSTKPAQCSQVPPISIRQRILKAASHALRTRSSHGSTHLDPSEDTESGTLLGVVEADGSKFHPSRSVRGY